jgi:hypothetical protein
MNLLDTEMLPKLAPWFRYFMIVSFALIVAAEFVQFDSGETAALWWHLKHGVRDRCCGVEVRVPLMYFGGGEDTASITLISVPGYIRSRLLHSPHAIVHIGVNSTLFDEEHIRQATERWTALWTPKGYRLVGTKAIRVTGNSMTCSELFDALGPDYNVVCVGKDITAMFSGSPALLSEFYAVLEGASPTIEEMKRITKQ